MKLGFTGRIARASAARPWLTVAIWVLVLAAAVVMSGRLDSALSQEDHYLTTVESDTAADLIDAAKGDDSGQLDETIVVTSARHVFTDDAFQAAIAEASATLAGLEGVTEVAAPSIDQPMPVSASGHSALLTVSVSPDAPEGLGTEINDALAELSSDEVGVYPYGQSSAEAAFNEMAAEGMVKGEMIGIGAALVILVLVFGALVASGLPLVVAGVSIVAAIGATAVVGQLFDLSFFIVNMITMMGLALGIDYSLVVVQRFREEVAGGATVRDAVAIAGNTASRAVFFSGVTVLISLAGMLVVPFTVMVSLGTGAMIVAVMAMLAALTLLPALLRLLGHRVNGGRLPWAHPGGQPRVWRAIARGVMRRPVVGAVAGVALLGTLAVPALSMRMTYGSSSSLPQDMPYALAVQTLSEEFGYGDTWTRVVITDAADARAEVEQLATAVEANPNFAETELSWVGDTAFIDTRDVLDASTTEAEQAVKDLRSDVATAIDGTDARAYVGGDVASLVDFNGVMSDSAPWVALIVLGSSLLLLLVTFRSLVVAVTAVALNALSTAAAYGVLVAVFQWGWLADALGMPVVGGVIPWLPVFLFAVLFGLSMDYHVFLLSRIKERYGVTGKVHDAIEFGLSRTGSLITGAALIMVAVFVGFALGDMTAFNQMGLGLAAAIILDATVVRTVLVPSLMTMLGERNWYLPAWLRWLPHLEVESSGTAKLEPEMALVR